MQSTVLIANADAAQNREISDLLIRSGYRPEVVDSIEGLRSRLRKGAYLAVLLNVDTLPVEDRTFHGLSFQQSATPILCMSRKRFHPELKAAMSHTIFACINAPVDPAELLYWLRCIRDDT